ncbi:MAG TPA: outer membrane beta-barrel protein [Ignavibacteriaceae bacterium]|nr:outer membrane beta-barrel protein [Ignavibacteriaceae bacterium]
MFIKKLLLLLTVFIFALTTTLFSQEENGKEEKSDTAEADKNEKWDNDKWEDFKMEFDLFDSHKSPSVSVTYGFSSINLQNFSGSFANPNIPELKLGYTSEHPAWSEEGILKYKYNYLFLSNVTTDISGTPGSNEIESNLWRFGLGWANGYGYDLGSAAIIPYNSYSLAWSKLNVKNFPANEQDKNKLALFDDAFRFGTGSEAGIRIKVIRQITVEAGYERSVIFERHLFWKWAGSALIEGIGHWALDSFVDEIMDSSPYAAPIVGFVLKSALSYGVYELRQDKMNWPFKSAAPLAYDQVKFGMTFTF